MTEPAARRSIDRPEAVLFDIDGTLVDSNYLHVAAWVQAFADVGHPVDAWRIHRGMGMDSGSLLESLLGEDADRLGEPAKARHTAHYDRLVPLLRVLPGARELLARLAADNIAVVLATSAPPDELEHLRATLDVEAELTAVTAADDVETAKPAPDIVAVALDKAGVPADRALFVGDAVWDVEAAARAGVPCVAVRSGGSDSGALIDAGAVAVYDDVAALLAAVTGSAQHWLD